MVVFLIKSWQLTANLKSTCFQRPAISSKHLRSSHLLRFTSLSCPLPYVMWYLTFWKAWYTQCCLMLSCFTSSIFHCLVSPSIFIYTSLTLPLRLKSGTICVKTPFFSDASLSSFHLPITSNASLCNCTWQTVLQVCGYLSGPPLEIQVPGYHRHLCLYEGGLKTNWNLFI